MHSKSYRFLTPLIMVLTWANMEAQTSHPVPRLVVNVTIDQLRTDYMEAFSSLFGAGGFNKVMRDGRSYMDAAYPFSHIDRASAVACIMTARCLTIMESWASIGWTVRLYVRCIA